MNLSRRRIAPGPGQESVWDYPRPPRLEKTDRRLQIVFAGRIIANTRRAYRVLETSHPPVYYLPPEDIRMEVLVPADGTSFCEWKGLAGYYSVQIGERIASKAAWRYPSPTPAFLFSGLTTLHGTQPPQNIVETKEAIGVVITNGELRLAQVPSRLTVPANSLSFASVYHFGNPANYSLGTIVRTIDPTRTRFTHLKSGSSIGAHDERATAKNREH